MNILFLSAWFPYPSDNGSKIRVLHLLRHLVRRHAVTFVSFAFGTAKPDASNDLLQMCHSVHVLRMDPIQQAQMGTLRTFLALTPSAARTIPQMHALVRHLATSQQFDAVVASTTTMSGYALQVSQPGARILEEHNSLARWMHERWQAQTAVVQRARCWVSWQKARRFEHALYRQFDLVTMVSTEDLGAVSAVLGADRWRVALVSNGVDCLHNRPDLAQPSPDHLVFNGALSYSANFEAMRWFLAEIYPRILRAQPGVTLSITGSTTGVELGRLDLHPGVQLTGFVDDIRTEVARASVCVVPIREGGGSRLKVLEAMALGTPVVATSKGAEGLEVTPGEHLLVADDPEAFARAVIDLLTNPPLLAKLASDARRLVEERYEWRQIGQRFVDLMEASVERSRYRQR
jgi:glycosyltransferase involved in cell wall biosynthesis